MESADYYVQNEWAVFWSGERVQCPYCKTTRKIKTSDNGATLHFPIKCPKCQTVLVHKIPINKEG